MDEFVFDERGLMPAIVQDVNSREVLMLAWMTQQALSLTQSTELAHFWSRSRASLWRKGDTSGNRLHVKEIRYDCDADALLLLVEPAGPACHTGEITCFYRTLEA